MIVTYDTTEIAYYSFLAALVLFLGMFFLSRIFGSRS